MIRLPAQAFASLFVGALLLAACGGGSSPVPIPAGGLYLATGFEQPVCGNYHNPGKGCELGIEGQVRAGPFDCRTGEWCVEEQRGTGGEHVGVLSVVPVREGHAFVGCAFRVPELPAAQKPFIELMQLSPSDGTQGVNPIEVRFSIADRTLSLGAFRGPDEPWTTWQAPANEWFYVVVEMAYGENATNRLWVYDANDQQVAQLEVSLVTAGGRGRDLPRQKIGGVTNTLSDALTYADDWYIASENLGPLHIGPNGQPITG